MAAIIRFASAFTALVFALSGCSSGPTWHAWVREQELQPLLTPRSEELPGSVFIVREGKFGSPSVALRPLDTEIGRAVVHTGATTVTLGGNSQFSIGGAAEFSDQFALSLKANGVSSYTLGIEGVKLVTLDRASFVSAILIPHMKDGTPLGVHSGEILVWAEQLLLVKKLAYSFYDSKGANIGLKVKKIVTPKGVFGGDLGIEGTWTDAGQLVFVQESSGSSAGAPTTDDQAKTEKAGWRSMLCLGYSYRQIIFGKSGATAGPPSEMTAGIGLGPLEH